jgi:hypothetical protein
VRADALRALALLGPGGAHSGVESFDIPEIAHFVGVGAGPNEIPGYRKVCILHDVVHQERENSGARSFKSNL